MDISVSGTIDQKTASEKFREGFSPLSPPWIHLYVTFLKEQQTRFWRNSNVAELRRNIWVKEKQCLNVVMEWRLRNVQTHVEFHDVYQGQSKKIASRGEFFHRIFWQFWIICKSFFFWLFRVHVAHEHWKSKPGEDDVVEGKKIWIWSKLTITV